jgi:hypothetical protein
MAVPAGFYGINNWTFGFAPLRLRAAVVCGLRLKLGLAMAYTPTETRRAA